MIRDNLILLVRCQLNVFFKFHAFVSTLMPLDRKEYKEICSFRSFAWQKFSGKLIDRSKTVVVSLEKRVRGLGETISFFDLRSHCLCELRTILEESFANSCRYSRLLLFAIEHSRNTGGNPERREVWKQRDWIGGVVGVISGENKHLGICLDGIVLRNNGI